ncbi:hypothetical protein LTR72_012422, partial [Exophiala xenobiotica]
MNSNWLNDDALEAVLGVLEDDRVEVRLLYKEYDCGQNRRIRLWLRRNTLYVVMPVNFRSHWTLAILNLRDCQLHHFDSLYENDSKEAAERKAYILDILGSLQERNKVRFNSELVFITETSRKQPNVHDCGVFTCLNAFEWFLKNRRLPDRVDSGMW